MAKQSKMNFPKTSSSHAIFCTRRTHSGSYTCRRRSSKQRMHAARSSTRSSITLNTQWDDAPSNTADRCRQFLSSPFLSPAHLLRSKSLPLPPAHLFHSRALRLPPAHLLRSHRHFPYSTTIRPPEHLLRSRTFPPQPLHHHSSPRSPRARSSSSPACRLRSPPTRWPSSST